MNDQPRGPVPAPVLHSDVLDRLGKEITYGLRAPGSVLTIAELEREHGVSRTVVREAVRVLESMGMVESRRRVGVTVRPVSEWAVLSPQLVRWRLQGPGRDAQLKRLTELRSAVEPTAARLAAAKAGPEVGTRLTELAAVLRELGESGKGDSQEYLDADNAFHALLLRASGNDMLAALETVITEVLTGRTRLRLTPAWPVPASLDNHEEVARAVVAGDGDRAEHFARAVVVEVWHELHDVSFTPPLE